MRSLLIPLIGLPAALGVAWAGWRVENRCDGDEPAARAQTETTKQESRAATTGRTWTTAVDPKPLSSQVKKGLDWLVHNQLPSGGWGQGEESPNMRGGGGDPLRDKPNVADTCIAALALIRSGNTPRQGPYKEAIAKAVQFVSEQVESADSESIAVTSVQGTRVQQKLGPNIDTFLASLLLAEVKGRMPDVEQESRTNRALTKVLDKIHKHQKADGTFDGPGWAPVIAWALCGKGINRAQQAGAAVPPTALARAEASAKLAFESTPTAGASTTAAPGSITGAGRVAGMYGGYARGSAGVELYDRAASLGVLQDSVNTNKERVNDLRQKAQNARDDKEREAAKVELSRIGDLEKTNAQAQQAVVDRLKDPQFVAGFGSNGGEEFLSYMNIGESLVVKGGAEWKKWDESMTANMNRIQNDDGSWTGHHCITGRTFCTASALLVLMCDRTPVPVQGKEGVKVSSTPVAPAAQR